MPRQKLVVLSGAGVSAESGFATFRDNGGLWDQYDPQEVCSVQGWRRNPAKLQAFYNGLRAQLKDARPNAAHLAIADLEKEYDVRVITQNVDNLHERAGSTSVLHLHGELTKVRPENTYNDWDGYSTASVIDVGYEPVGADEKGANGARLRPHIVFFGEAVPNIEKAVDIVSQADIFLIVGSSLQVYPAAGLYRYAPYDKPVYIIDPAELLVSDPRIVHIKEVASKGMETFRKMLCEKA